MPSKEHIEILKLGVKRWNEWRIEYPNIAPDLSRLRLDDVLNISGDWKAIDFSNTDLESSDLFSIDLDKSNFQNASLQNCNCYGASFDMANFKSADLQLANFTLSSLHEANFDGVYLGNTVFGSCNLSSVKNLETCEHLHSSIIDHFTLLESGNLPITFLRGCGLPDFIIDNISALAADAITFNSCFISYSSTDSDFAKRIYTDLQNAGIRCWFAPEDMSGGKKTISQINEAINIHEKLLLIISDQSMKSTWVATEIKKARSRERIDNRQMLFPISIVPYDNIKTWELFDADSGSDLAAEIRSYHIPDFTNWKTLSNYEPAFKKLVSSIKKI